jgi:hypothetical protein
MAATARASILSCSARIGGRSGNKIFFRDAASDKLDHHDLSPCHHDSRVGVVLRTSVAAQAFPVVGALGGAVVDYAFIEHCRDVARGHFTVRRLERIYGKESIRTEYDLIAFEL